MISKNFNIKNNNCNINCNISCKIYCENIRSLDKIVIYFHGFGGHKDNKAAERFANAIIAKEKKTGVITFNWPGHGDDIKKRLVFSDCNDYLKAVVNYVRDELRVSDIYAYGTSFGAFVVLEYIAAFENPFKKMAFRCPAIPFHDVLKKAIMNEEDFRLLEKGKDALIGFDTKVLINQAFLDDAITADISNIDYIDFADDILIIHGLKDEIVPFEGVQEFCERNVIEFIAVENADHRFCDLNDLNWANNKALEFFKE